MISSSFDRRGFLKQAGVALALPALDVWNRSHGAEQSAIRPRRRMVLINVGFGFYAPNFFPKTPGRDYESTPYMELLQDFRQDFSVISGTLHPDVDGGHVAGMSFLTAAPKPVSADFKNTISLDQFAADHIGQETRFRSLPLSLTPYRSLSHSRDGVEIPAESKPSNLFASLFLEGKPADKQRQIQRLKDGRSILDRLADQRLKLQQQIGARDRDKLDQYFTAVRTAEQRLLRTQAWEDKPKPHIDAKPPADNDNHNDLIGRARLMFDMIHLALQSDSTRLITLHNPGINAVPTIKGVTQDYHNLSHHGQDVGRLNELKLIEMAQIKVFAEFLGKLRETREEDETLLDRSLVLLGSEMGNASSHDNRNLPIILAGGGLRHGQHVAFDPRRNYPLSNVFLTMLQQLGIEIDKFGSSTGTVTELMG